MNPPALGPSLTKIIGVCPQRFTEPTGYPWSSILDGCSPCSGPLFLAFSENVISGPVSLYPVRLDRV